MVREIEASFDLPRRGIDQKNVVGKLVGNKNLLLAVRAFHHRKPSRRRNRHSLGQGLADLVLRAARGKMLQRNRNQPLGLEHAIRKAVDRDRVAGVIGVSALGRRERVQADIKCRAVERERNAGIHRLRGADNGALHRESR